MRLRNFSYLTACPLLGVLLTNCGDGMDRQGTEENLGTVSNALVVSSNETGTHDGFYYTYWKDGGTVSMDLLTAGHYTVAWNSGSYNYVGGKGWSAGSATRVIGYNAGAWSTGTSNAYLTLYGWSTGPLVEYYIVDSWGSWRPPGTTASGTVTTDGGTYDIYRTQRVQQPSILGVQTFYQYWSVRQTKRATGQNNTITFANHKDAWAAQGWNLGNLADTTNTTYQVLATEVFNPASNGSSDITVWESGGGGGGGSSAFQMASGQVSMEAEHAQAKVTMGDSWTEISDVACSGDQALSLGPDSGNAWTSSIESTAPHIRFDINFTSTGTFYAHVRGDNGGGTTGTGDSCFGGIDGVANTSNYDFADTNGTWGWQTKSFTVNTTGAHTFTVWGREDGFKVDKVVINQSSTAPTGDGPAESSLSGGSCTPTTCSALGATCGSPSNGCGGTLSCGTCSSGYTCNSSSYTCEASCTPTTCSALGATCGSPSNGCGGSLSCGTCSSGYTCNSSYACEASGGGSTPCSGLCSNPTVMTSTSVNSTGTSAICYEYNGTKSSGNFGNFSSTRHFYINGTDKGTSSGSYTLPATRNGGYCFQSTAGDFAWGYFGIW